jgi:non-homologous end joining protein Ku
MRTSIEQMTRDFYPTKYANIRRKKLMDLLAAKAKEKALVEAPAIEEEAREGPADLVAALEESMRKVKAG